MLVSRLPVTKSASVRVVDVMSAAPLKVLADRRTLCLMPIAVVLAASETIVMAMHAPHALTDGAVQVNLVLYVDSETMREAMMAMRGASVVSRIGDGMESGHQESGVKAARCAAC